MRPVANKTVAEAPSVDQTTAAASETAAATAKKKKNKNKNKNKNRKEKKASIAQQGWLRSLLTMPRREKAMPTLSFRMPA
jgi:CelD/BcsL family acetyltransferase involved in cellulose biosynthesis